MMLARLTVAHVLEEHDRVGGLSGFVAVMARLVAAHAYQAAREQLERETAELRAGGAATPEVGAFAVQDLYEGAFRGALRVMADAIREVYAGR